MHVALILLPASVYAVLTAVLWTREARGGLLGALIGSHLLVFTFIALSTELLSAAGALTTGGVLTAWLLFMGAALLALHRRGGPSALPAMPFTRPPLLHLPAIAALALLLTATLVTSLLYPPNTWDSMTYHMSRVAHWIERANVEFYPTGIPRQNHQIPLAEFAIVQLQLLTGSDLFAGLVQWVSYGLCIATASVIALELSLSGAQRLLVALLVATIPMAILQASSTQNDLVVGAFIAAFALAMLRLERDFTRANLLMASASLGLALFTKGTAYLYCAGIGSVLGVSVLLVARDDGPPLPRRFTALALVVVGALALNAAHYVRNFELYGHPLSTETKLTHSQDLSPAAISANTLRNVALHAGLPSREINDAVERWFVRILGEQVSNPKTTLPGTSFTIPFAYHEDHAGNPVHAALALLAVLALPWLASRPRHRRSVRYACAALLGGLLFCALVRWQPWASRLHTPVFVLLCPFLVMVPATLFGRRGTHVTAVVALLALYHGAAFATDNASRPLRSSAWQDYERADLYFTNRPALHGEYRSVAQYILRTGAIDVGLAVGRDDWEYPLWALPGHPHSNVRFRHVWVQPAPQPVGDARDDPELVIATTSMKSLPQLAAYRILFGGRFLTVARRTAAAGE